MSADTATNASTASVATEAETWPRPSATGLEARQFMGILRVELRRSLLSKRATALYFLVFSPLILFVFWAIAYMLFQDDPPTNDIGEAGIIFAMLFHIYIRVIVFLSTLLMFMSLFRSDILEKSLHYYFLTNVRREVLVFAKYLSALIASWVTIGVATVLLYVLYFLPWGGAFAHHLFEGPGLGHLVAYIATSMFGVAGYGAVFLLTGLYFRNPVIPAVMVWFWEASNWFLPALLKRMSIVFYLQGFYPVLPPSSQIFRVEASLPPAWMAILGVAIFTGVVLFLSAWRAREMELTYTSED